MEVETSFHRFYVTSALNPLDIFTVDVDVDVDGWSELNGIQVTYIKPQ